MKYKFLLSVVLLFNILLCGEESKITFVISAYKLDDSSSVYITGNDEKIGEWDPALIKLNKEQGNRWKIELSFPKGTKLEYKFTLGDWKMEALNGKGETPNNSLLTVVNDTIVSVTINHWGSAPPRRISFHGQITGEVKYHRNFRGEGILPR